MQPNCFRQAGRAEPMTHYGVLDAMQSLAHWSVQFDSYEKANKAQIAKDCGGEQFYTDAIRPSELG
jgi:hypothetical protein